jgi:hypothetical protein
MNALIDRIVQDDRSTSDGDSKSSSFTITASRSFKSAAAVVYLLNAPKRNSLDRLLLNFYAYHGSNVQYCSTGANQDDIDME